MTSTFSVRVPASSANLGPAFDSLAMALDLWNETTFSLEGTKLQIEISGEGKGTLPKNQDNLIFASLQNLLVDLGAKVPRGIKINCQNRIPLSSGLGSSAAAVLTGLLAGNQIAGGNLSVNELLSLAAKIEGHADNAAAALLGGLILVTQDEGTFNTQRLPSQILSCVLLIPNVEISTQQSRKILDDKVALADAVFNIGNAMALIEGFKNGDIALINQHMHDRLHQPPRLSLIAGAEEAMIAARNAGAAVALSGAGPGLIAFVTEGREKAITEAMRAPFAALNVQTKQYLLKTNPEGANLIEQD
jgi:homoserine kinase